MPDWDADSVPLRENLLSVLLAARIAARQRAVPTLDVARQWQREVMQGLAPQVSHDPGAFRGEASLQAVEVEVLGQQGAASATLARELATFEATLQRSVAELDRLIPSGALPDADQLAAVLDLCAWVHAEWVRLHPFVNGNGRTARVWANSIAMRYDLPPFVRLRPRPDSGYADAAAKAMTGDWRPTSVCFRQLLFRFLDEAGKANSAA